MQKQEGTGDLLVLEDWSRTAANSKDQQSLLFGTSGCTSPKKILCR